jgi:alkyl hydroperoxide reductase subunit AhpC
MSLQLGSLAPDFTPVRATGPGATSRPDKESAKREVKVPALPADTVEPHQVKPYLRLAPRPSR